MCTLDLDLVGSRAVLYVCTHYLVHVQSTVRVLCIYYLKVVVQLLYCCTAVQGTIYIVRADTGFRGHSMVSTPLLKLSLCKDNVELKCIVEI